MSCPDLEQENSYKSHCPIMLTEILSFLEERIELNRRYLFNDLTFGAGGHSLAILDKFANLDLIAFDQDIEAVRNAKELIKSKNLENRLSLYHSNFEKIVEILPNTSQFKENQGVDFILMDIGVSTHHLLESKRGFSFREDGPLDMRMDPENNLVTAKDLLNELSSEELEQIFLVYGEEKFSKRIAQKIVDYRQSREITTTKELEDIIFNCYPKNLRYGKRHPATQVFQALRIYVNRELEVLEQTLPLAFSLLKPKGLLIVITFHSLEDRIVKNLFKKLSKEEKIGRLLSKKVIIPSAEEIIHNPRSRSAKMRIIEKF